MPHLHIHIDRLVLRGTQGPPAGGVAGWQRAFEQALRDQLAAAGALRTVAPAAQAAARTGVPGLAPAEVAAAVVGVVQGRRS